MLSKRQAGSKFKTHSSKLKEWVGRGMLNACKPGSVVGGHLSRPCGRLPRRLGSCSQLSTGSASHLSRASALRSFRRLLQGGLPFSLHVSVAWSLLLSLPRGSACMDCQDPRPALPPLSRGTLLCAARTFLCLSAATTQRTQTLPNPFVVYRP